MTRIPLVGSTQRYVTLTAVADGTNTKDRGEPLEWNELGQFRMWAVRNGQFHEEVLGCQTALGNPSVFDYGPTLGAAVSVTADIGDLILVCTWTKGGAGVPTHTLQSGYTQLATQDFDDGATDGRISLAYYNPNGDALGSDLVGTNSFTAYAVSGGTATITYTTAIVLPRGQYYVPGFNVASASETAASPLASPTLLAPSHAYVALAFHGLHTNGAQTITPTIGGTGWFPESSISGSVDSELLVSSKIDGASVSPGMATYTGIGTLNGSAAIAVAIPRAPGIVPVSDSVPELAGLYRWFAMGRWLAEVGNHTLVIITEDGSEEMIRREMVVEVYDHTALATTIDGVLTSSHGAGTWAGGATASAVADAVWDEARADHVASGSFGENLQDAALGILHRGTAQNGDAVGITLAAGAPFATDALRNNMVVIVGGTGVGQSTTIIGNDGTSKYASVADAWSEIPDNSSKYVVLADGSPMATAIATLEGMTVEASYSLADLTRLMVAVLAGKVTNFETGLLAFLGLDDATPRLTVQTAKQGRITKMVGTLT